MPLAPRERPRAPREMGGRPRDMPSAPRGMQSTPRDMPFAPREMSIVVEAPKPAPAAREKPPRVKEKIDPQLVAKARELRDRYLEHVNAEQVNERLLIAPRGKYDVSRALAAPTPLALPSAA